MNKYFLLMLLMVLSDILYGQYKIDSRYMDLSLDTSTINSMQYTEVVSRSRLLTYRPSKMFKLTIKTQGNTNVLGRINVSNVVNGVDDLGMILNSFDISDVVSIASYDIRVKVYLNRRTNLLCRCLASGVETSTYYYYAGLTYFFR